QAELGGPRLGRLAPDIGETFDVEDEKVRGRLEIGLADVAASDDADAEPLHVRSLFALVIFANASWPAPWFPRGRRRDRAGSGLRRLWPRCRRWPHGPRSRQYRPSSRVLPPGLPRTAVRGEERRDGGILQIVKQLKGAGFTPTVRGLELR